MGIRRKAREFVLQYLYQIDLNETHSDIDLESFWQEHAVPPEVKKFASELIDTVLQFRTEIDEILKKHSTHWKLTRMAGVDRNILRFAVAEIKYKPEIPSSVSINEAVEIAKKFGTVDSASFINGILDQISKLEKHD